MSDPTTTSATLEVTPEEEEAFVRAAAAADTGGVHPENNPEAGEPAVDVPDDTGPPPTQAEIAYAQEIESDTLDIVGTDRADAELTADEKAADDQADQELPSEVDVESDVAGVDVDDIEGAGFTADDLPEPPDPEVISELREAGGA